MTKKPRYPTLLAAAFFSLAIAGTCTGPGAEVRAPAVSGQFYPADPIKLRLAIQQFLKDAVPPMQENPIAIIVPHAGYIYSGQICADGYRQAAGNACDLVVILGTNHTTANFNGISIFPKGAFQTPLGNAIVDEDAARVLLARDKDCTVDVKPQEREHSVAVQVPFVQVVFPSAKILPIVIGQPDLNMCTHFGQELGKTLKGRKALIVASSDLSHYPAYQDAVRADRETLRSLIRIDPREFAAKIRATLSSGIPNLETCACGEAPILAAMAAARELGATRGAVVSYANSGDGSAGDLARVVGYGAAVLTGGKAPPNAKALDPAQVPAADTLLQTADKKTLLSIARESLRRFITTDTVPLVRSVSPRLQSPQGAFVTLKKHGELRGCIGHIPPDFPLARAVGAMALQAAFGDTRFPQLALSELEEVEIEISVLTPMIPIARVQDIVVGRDGVVISKNGKSAVFLPQVAVEQKWGRTELLDNLCIKAGMARDSWKEGAQFFVFQAIVFDESQFK